MCLILFATPWTEARQASLCFTISQSLLKLMSIETVRPSNHLILCCPLPLLPSIFPSIRVFSSVLIPRIRWPNYWSFSFRISLSNSGLISFRMDWLYLLAVQGTLKSLSNTPVQKHQFFAISILYGPTLTSIHDSWKKTKFEFVVINNKMKACTFLLLRDTGYNLTEGWLKVHCPDSLGLWPGPLPPGQCLVLSVGVWYPGSSGR